MVNGISGTQGYAANAYAQENAGTFDPAIREIKAKVDTQMARQLTTDQVNFNGQNPANQAKEEESGLPWGKIAAGALAIGGAVFAYKKGGIGKAWESIKGLWSKAPAKPAIKRDSSKFKHLDVNPVKVSKETIHVPAGRTLSVDKDGNYILKKSSPPSLVDKTEVPGQVKKGLNEGWGAQKGDALEDNINEAWGKFATAIDGKASTVEAANKIQNSDFTENLYKALS